MTLSPHTETIGQGRGRALIRIPGWRLTIGRHEFTWLKLPMSREAMTAKKADQPVVAVQPTHWSRKPIWKCSGCEFATPNVVPPLICPKCDCLAFDPIGAEPVTAPVIDNAAAAVERAGGTLEIEEKANGIN